MSICLRITTPLQKKHFRVEKEEILVIEKVYLKPIEVSQPPPQVFFSLFSLFSSLFSSFLQLFFLSFFLFPLVSFFLSFFSSQVVSPPPKDNISKENSSSKDSPSSNLSPQNTAPIEKDSSNLSNPNDSSSQETPSQEIPSQTSSQDTASKNSSPLPTDSTTTTTTTKEKEKIQQPPEPQNRNQEQNQNQGQNQNQKEKEKEKEKEEKKEKRGDEVTEEEIEKLESVQNLISDSVLEWSLNDTLRMIQERKRKKEETDDLEFRKSQIELKMNMLIVQVFILFSVISLFFSFLLFSFLSCFVVFKHNIYPQSPFPSRSKQNNSQWKNTLRCYKKRLKKKGIGPKNLLFLEIVMLQRRRCTAPS